MDPNPSFQSATASPSAPVISPVESVAFFPPAAFRPGVLSSRVGPGMHDSGYVRRRVDGAARGHRCVPTCGFVTMRDRLTTPSGGSRRTEVGPVPKRGLPYQDLVAKVEAALDPDAEVTVGEWIEGPDGERDCDVSVRGTQDGRPYFVLIECKDWNKPVGIATVDGLDSVRRDLGVDLAMIYSNSGFSGPAIKKANRLGINLLTAVASNDGRSRARAEMFAYGRLLDVTNYNEQVIEPEGQDLPIPPGVTMENILYEGKPVHNWLVTQVEQELGKDDDRFGAERYVLTLKYRFGSVATFDMAGVPFPVAGVIVTADVEVKWMSKVLSMSADLARFNLKTSLLTIPPSTPIELGPLNNEDWEPSEAPPRDRRRDPDVSEFRVTAELQSRAPVSRGGTADLDPIVAEKSVTLEVNTSQ